MYCLGISVNILGYYAPNRSEGAISFAFVRSSVCLSVRRVHSE